MSGQQSSQASCPPTPPQELTGSWLPGAPQPLSVLSSQTESAKYGMTRAALLDIVRGQDEVDGPVPNGC